MYIYVACYVFNHDPNLGHELKYAGLTLWLICIQNM